MISINFNTSIESLISSSMDKVRIKGFEINDQERSDNELFNEKALHSLKINQPDSYLSCSIDNISVNLLENK